MTQQGWPERLAAQVAAEVRRHRTRRGMSAQQLADECKNLGMPIQRSVIANFENGRRANVGVAELLVFAAALRVSPMELAFPVGYEHSSEGLPGKVQETYNWAGWWSGEYADLPNIEFVAKDVNAMEILRGLMPMLRALIHSKEQLTEAEAAFDQVRDSAQGAEDRIEEAQRHVEEIMARREANLSAREAATDLSSEEYKPLADEGAQLSMMYQEALASLEQARMEVKDFFAKQSSVNYWRETTWEDETSVREILATFGAFGFVPPDLPEELAYLLQPEPEESHQRMRRTRVDPQLGRN
ncbi:helix-turn-helix transcriptional regulator [Streptomyces sp. NPDC051954]|uniref:helix-turn-helix transcriptional regulator n=1 Tax=Streptomyces sp. NPDC051954 TaxID=3155524 RepID=UPI0034181FF4